MGFIQSSCKKLYEMFDKSNSYLSEELSKFLSDEQDLKRFYTYVKEFNEQNMTVTEEQFTYIREEIIADFLERNVERYMSKNIAYLQSKNI